MQEQDFENLCNIDPGDEWRKRQIANLRKAAKPISEEQLRELWKQSVGPVIQEALRKQAEDIVYQAMLKYSRDLEKLHGIGE